MTADPPTPEQEERKPDWSRYGPKAMHERLAKAEAECDRLRGELKRAAPMIREGWAWQDRAKHFQEQHQSALAAGRDLAEAVERWADHLLTSKQVREEAVRFREATKE